MRTLGSVGGFVEAAAAFLAGKGCNVARNALRRNGLPLDLFDDLTQEVLVRAWRVEQRGVEVANPNAFTVTLIQRQAQDMIRGILRRPEGHIDDIEVDDDTKIIDVRPPFDGAEDKLIAKEQLQHVRQRLATELGAQPKQAAGALVVLAIAVDSALPAVDVPVPKGGIDSGEATAWAGVFYAGGHDCFPTNGGREDAAMRKRRSRALERQKHLLADVAATLDPITEHDDA